jgi:hypothetical protein
MSVEFQKSDLSFFMLKLSLAPVEDKICDGKNDLPLRLERECLRKNSGRRKT